MPTDDSITELMLHWEAARQQGRQVTPEELCADRPDVLKELRQRIRTVQTMEQVLGVASCDRQPTVIAAPGDAAPAHQEPMPVIPGYELVRLIGQGGMGVVYEARQSALGRTVAVKMIAGAPLRPTTLARFRIEAEAAARLQHPNFVQIFEIGQVNGRPFFSMEYVAGGNLADLLKQQSLAPRDAAALLETLARAVHAAHERGIVHRDLKPANVLLSKTSTDFTDLKKRLAVFSESVKSVKSVDDCVPKISDFGLAKRLDDDSKHTHTGEILGTPAYMAPEQAAGAKDKIGPHTDVYALGAILYELLAGQPPFQGASPLDALRRVIDQEPVAPTRLAKSVPRELEAICLKCLEKAPSQRYPSALALAEDLRRFLNGQPVTARRTGPLGRAWKWMRRHRQLTALIAALVVLALIPILWLIEGHRAQRHVQLKALEQAPLVREILERNCFACHGRDPKSTEKKLNILDQRQLLDSSRRIVVAGAPENSRLIQRIADGSMPPEKDEAHLPRVSEKELTILSDWIRGGAPPLPPADPEHPVESAAPYSKSAAKAKAIFHKQCYECHKYDVAEGGIKILHHRLLVAVRKVVIPGRPDDSELFQLIESEDDEQRMPPAPAARLSGAEIAAIRAWIEEARRRFQKVIDVAMRS